MKKLFLTLAVLLSVATLSAQNYRETGTKWIVEAGTNPLEYGGGEPYLSNGTGIMAGFGYQFNPYLFLGASSGFVFSKQNWVPLMVDFRYYILNRKNTPFLGIRVGQNFELKTTGDFKVTNGGLLAMPQLGYAFGNFTISAWVFSRLYQSGVNQLTFKKNLVFGLGWTF